MAQRIKLALLTSGLGHVHRGFEISTATWYEALKDNDRLAVRLFSGGNWEDSTRVASVRRDSTFARRLARWLPLDTERRWQVAYVIEQISFAFALIPHLISWRPHIVWSKEVPLAQFLDGFRHLLGLDYRIIFANGAPFNPPTYELFDYIQHLEPDAYLKARDHGIPSTRMEVLPNLSVYDRPAESRQELRRRYGYTESDWVVICLAAWNRYHKRLDYLIEEIASLNDPTVKLLACGQPETETPSLKGLARRLLGRRVSWQTLPRQEVAKVLCLADCFVLPSLQEGLGSAIVEAAMAGLPVVCHPHAGARYILGDDRWMTDLSRPGNLAIRLKELRNHPPSQAVLSLMQEQVQAKFGAGALGARFVEMVHRVAVKDGSTTRCAWDQS